MTSDRQSPIPVCASGVAGETDLPIKRVLLVFGTRPEAIKMAPLIQAIEGHPRLQPVVALTGQHREMLNQVIEWFGLIPKHNLEIMRIGATLSELTARAVTGVATIVVDEKPDLVVVQGDTTSAFAAALAAFYATIPVAHLEAGLRTGDLSAPFPEEANRKLISQIAALHFAPTPRARANLLAEGVLSESIVVTGNTVIDALLDTLKRPVLFRDGALAQFVNRPGRLILVTVHRRESWGAPMRSAMKALKDVAAAEPDARFIVPLHSNPRVREVVRDVLADQPRFYLCEPLSYPELAHVLQKSHLVVTDSGGLQEESPSIGKPVLVLRDATERPEAVEAGAAMLVGTNRSAVGAALLGLLRSPAAYSEMANAVNPFGDGQASRRAIAAVEHFFGLGDRVADFDPGGSDRAR